ncbi:MAG: SAM-dependent methyltransferase [Actinomadura sp.]
MFCQADDLVRGFDTSTANVARVYDALLGGKDNYAADRAAVARLRELLPCVEAYALENRAFLTRAVTYLAGEGIRQFLDIGAGLPTRRNVHEMAQSVAADARVVYVDHDPLVLCHGRALLARDDRAAVVEGDLRDPEGIIGDCGSQRLIDFDRPVAVLLASILHLIDDAENPRAIVARLCAALAPGSYLVISHVEDHPDVAAACDVYREDLGCGTPRGSRQIAELFDGLEMADPGLVHLPRWRAESRPRDHMNDLRFYGGVARTTA